MEVWQARLGRSIDNSRGTGPETRKGNMKDTEKKIKLKIKTVKWECY